MFTCPCSAKKILKRAKRKVKWSPLASPYFLINLSDQDLTFVLICGRLMSTQH
jgi:hypothetical protein